MRKFVGIAFGALVLLVVAGAGIEFLRESVAQGESVIPALAILAVPVLAAGFAAAWVLRLLVAPLRRHGNLTGLIGLAVAAALGAGVYALNSDVPLQRPDAAVTAAVAPACAGQAVAAAGRVTTGSTALNHVVVLSSAGAEFGWTGKPSVDWRPSAVGDVELVACIQPEDAVAVVEVCTYNGPSTTRYSARREISVVAAQTGVELARFSIANQPQSCPTVKSSDMPEIRATVDWWEVEDHLESLVKTGAFVDPDPEGVPGESYEPGWTSEPAWTEEPAGTPEPTAEVREVTLTKAMAQGLVTAKGTGDSLQSLDMTITSTADEPLTITVQAGTYFVPKRTATQTMVVINSAWIDVPARATVKAVLDVACAQMHDDQPGDTGKADAFTVRAALATGDLAKLLASETFRVADFRVQQFAVWTITSNPTKAGYVHLGSVGVGSGPTTAELREIKAMFTDAGIAAARYRALP